MNKEEIRKKVKEERNKLSEEFIDINSKKIAEKLFNMDVYKKVESIYIYMNFEKEVSTKEIIIDSLNKGKKVAIPKIANEVMEFYYISNIEDVSIGYYGIEEPIGTKLAKEENSLIIMPGVVFDKKKNRIGHGKGYYDKYLAKKNIENKIALAFDFQVLEEIPFENHDLIPDIIITEKTIVI